MSDLKKIFKTIEKGLPTKKSGVGIDIDPLIGPEIFDKSKGDYANISAVFDSSMEKIKPEAVISGRKNNVIASLASSGKDDIRGGLGYLTKDELTSFGIGASKSGKNSSVGVGFETKFSKGGAVEIGKGKDYIKDLL
jgi:hypothetical protein